MSVDVFDKDVFEACIVDIAWDNHKLDARWAGVVGNEHRYVITVKEISGTDEVVNILVNSSVNVCTGMSDGAGENSIRGWLADSEGKPLGNKTQRWVTRQPGWEKRLEEMIAKLVEMANSICFCRACNSLEKVFVVKKDGPNKNRLFKRCQCDNSFTWLDESAGCNEEVVPSCPKCGNRMVKRNGRLGEFWGCSKYPSCKGTLNIGQENVTPAEREDRLHKLNEKLNDYVKHTDSDGNLTAYYSSSKDGVKVVPLFTPSRFQQAIFNWVDKQYSDAHVDGMNLVVEALAGSGKTTTGVEMLKRVPRDQKVLFVAFNKHIAKTLQERAPAHVKATTLHSLGFAALRQAYNIKYEDVKKDKVNILLEPYMDLKTNSALISPIKQLVSLVKANLTGTSDEELMELADYYGVELVDSQGAELNLALIFDAVKYVIVKAQEFTNFIDYDDMCWLPVVKNVPCTKYDFIFVDEAQDLNKNQLALIQAHCNGNTKFVAVGDRYQSLYGFRGADVDSIPTIINTFQAQVLPLSITYRNPKAIVRLVNDKFPEIPLEAAEWAQEGRIEHSHYNMALNAMRSGDMVLCRTNAPLVKPCFGLIRQGVKAVIRGRDIGKGLITLLRKMKATDVYDLIEKLAGYRDVEVAKLLLAKKSGQAQSLEDKIDTIIALADDSVTIADIERKIETVFSDDVEGVVFSSVHRAKGLEADNVFILKPNLMPHPMATQEWELQQEQNIEYVALTRTKSTLTFVIGY